MTVWWRHLMIDVAKFEALVKKAETLKTTIAKAEGTIESTEKQLADLGITDVDAIDAVVAEKEATLTELEESMDSEFETLKGLYAWQFV